MLLEQPILNSVPAQRSSMMVFVENAVFLNSKDCILLRLHHSLGRSLWTRLASPYSATRIVDLDIKTSYTSFKHSFCYRCMVGYSTPVYIGRVCSLINCSVLVVSISTSPPPPSLTLPSWSVPPPSISVVRISWTQWRMRVPRTDRTPEIKC